MRNDTNLVALDLIEATSLPYKSRGARPATRTRAKETV